MSIQSTRRWVLACVVTAALTAAVHPSLAHDAAHHHPSTNAAPEHAQGMASTDVRSAVSEKIRAFRRSGDDRHLDLAWAMLEPRLEGDSPGAALLVDAATIAQARHEFDEALALTDQALARHPGYDPAHLTRAAIHLVRGNTDGARQACASLRHAPTLVSLTCRARVSIARGEHERSLRVLSAMLDAVDPASVDATVLAWAFSVAGDAAAAVEATTAIAHYRTSLRWAENAQVRAALVDQLIQSGRLEEADAALAAGHDALALTVRRLVVASRMGRGQSASARIARTDREFRHWIAHGDWAHAREMARFYLDVLPRPALARRLAQINLSLQREPEDLLLARRTRL